VVMGANDAGVTRSSKAMNRSTSARTSGLTATS
jgi:hypothetical protein